MPKRSLDGIQHADFMREAEMVIGRQLRALYEPEQIVPENLTLLVSELARQTGEDDKNS
jgi:hypothetical protein